MPHMQTGVHSGQAERLTDPVLSPQTHRDCPINCRFTVVMQRTAGAAGGSPFFLHSASDVYSPTTPRCKIMPVGSCHVARSSSLATYPCQPLCSAAMVL